MTIVLLHTKEAMEPPVDPVIAQITAALRAAEHEVETLMVDTSVERVVSALRAA